MVHCTNEIKSTENAFVAVTSGALMKNAVTSVQPSRLKTDVDRLTPRDTVTLLRSVMSPDTDSHTALYPPHQGLLRFWILLLCRYCRRRNS